MDFCALALTALLALLVVFLIAEVYGRIEHKWLQRNGLEDQDE